MLEIMFYGSISLFFYDSQKQYTIISIEIPKHS